MPIDFLTESGDFNTSKVAMLTLPVVGLSKVVKTLIVVVFPAPLGPKKPNISPSFTAFIFASPDSKISIDLSLLFNGTLSTDINYAQYATQAPVDDSSTAWDETLIWGWKNFHPERITGECDSAEAPLGTRCVNNEIDNAWKAYSNASDDLIKNEALAEKAKADKVGPVVLDRNGYPYHGRVKAFTKAARDGGLEL